MGNNGDTEIQLFANKQYFCKDIFVKIIQYFIKITEIQFWQANKLFLRLVPHEWHPF